MDQQNISPLFGLGVLAFIAYKTKSASDNALSEVLISTAFEPIPRINPRYKNSYYEQPSELGFPRSIDWIRQGHRERTIQMQNGFSAAESGRQMGKVFKNNSSIVPLNTHPSVSADLTLEIESVRNLLHERGMVDLIPHPMHGRGHAVKGANYNLPPRFNPFPIKRPSVYAI